MDKQPIDFFLPKKSTTTKGGEGSGNWGHGGLAGVWGGSSPTKTFDNIQVVTEEELAMLQKTLEESGGFSYNPVTDKSPTTGFMVSDHGSQRKIPRQKEYRHEMRQFIKENIDKFKESKSAYFGGWATNDNIYFDVSRNFQELKDAALRGIDEEQIAIFNIETYDEIFAIDYLDHIDKSLWTKERILKTYNSNLKADNPGNFMGKYREEIRKIFGEEFLSNFKEKRSNNNMTDKKEETKKPKIEKPIRFQFGADTTDEDIEKFLDMILGPEPKKTED